MDSRFLLALFLVLLVLGCGEWGFKAMGRGWGSVRKGWSHFKQVSTFLCHPSSPLQCFHLPKSPVCLQSHHHLGFLPEVQAAQQLQQDDPGSPALLGKVQESISSYWDTAKAAAQDLYQRTYLTSVDEKLRCVLPGGDRS